MKTEVFLVLCKKLPFGTNRHIEWNDMYYKEASDLNIEFNTTIDILRTYEDPALIPYNLIYDFNAVGIIVKI
jgi:hypothetical protein